MKRWKIAAVSLAVAVGIILVVPAIVNTPLYPHLPENPCSDSPASAAMIEPLTIYASPTPQERFDAAELIVIGRITDAAARCDGSQIMTYMQVEVEESLKNPQDIKTLTAKMYGGAIGDYEVRMEDSLLFKKGDRVFLYLNKEKANDDAYEISHYSGALVHDGSPDNSVSGREILETFRLEFITAENTSSMDIPRGSGKEVTLTLESFFGYDSPTNLTVSSFAGYRDQGVFSTENVTRLGDFGISIEPADAAITPPANGTAGAKFWVRASDEAVLGVYDIHVSSINEDKYSHIAGGIGETYIRINVTENGRQQAQRIALSSSWPAYDTISELESASSDIVTGQVLGVKRSDDNSMIPTTDFDFRVDRVIKGSLSPHDTITIRQTGAQNSTVLKEIPDDPLLRQGETLLGFMRYADGHDVYVILGGPQGRFIVQDGVINSMDNLYPRDGWISVKVRDGNLDQFIELIQDEIG